MKSFKFSEVDPRRLVPVKIMSNCILARNENVCELGMKSDSEATVIGPQKSKLFFLSLTV